MKRMLLTVLVLGGCLTARSLADPPAEPSPDEAAIRKMVTATSRHSTSTTPRRWPTFGRPTPCI